MRLFNAGSATRPETSAIGREWFMAFAAEDQSPKLIASNALVAPISSPTLTFRKKVEEVRVSFQASDKRGQPIVDLPGDSISVFDNGERVARISALQTASDLPLSVAIMVDTSDSVARDLLSEQKATSALLTGLMHANDDRVLLVGFRENVETMRPMSAHPEELIAAVRELKAGGLTALYDAVVSTSARLVATDSSASRRAIILLTDGDDTDSRFDLGDAMAAAVRNDVAIYSITLRSKHRNPDGENTLQLLTEATGGRTYVLRHPEELSRAVQEIERDLRTQYFLTYRPLNDGHRFHVVKVTSSIPDVSIRARKGYFATDAR
jgi:VWFA-related protein